MPGATWQWVLEMVNMVVILFSFPRWLWIWQIDINVVTFDTFETPVELAAHNL